MFVGEYGALAVAKVMQSDDRPARRTHGSCEGAANVVVSERVAILLCADVRGVDPVAREGGVLFLPAVLALWN